jgi:NTE family protein
MANGQHDNNLIEFIKKCRFFSSLSNDEILKIIPHFEKMHVSAGDTLFLQGDMSHNLYILLKGKLISVVFLAINEMKVLGTIDPGESVGELGALSGESRSLTVKAVVDSELIKLPSEKFQAICHDYPVILAEISKIVIERSLRTIKWIMNKKVKLGIIYPVLDDAFTRETVKSNIEKYIRPYQKVRLIFAEKIHLDQLITLLKQPETEVQAVFIYMDVWNPELFQICMEKLTNFYFISSANNINNLSDVTLTKIMNDIKHIPNIRAELILVHANNTRLPSQTKKWLEKSYFLMHHHLRLTTAEDYQRLIRFMTGNAFTLVLGGGGGKGLAHLGALKAITEKGIVIDAIGGTSSGSSIAACYAFTQDLENCILLTDKLKKSAESSFKLSGLTWPMISLYSCILPTEEVKKIFSTLCIEDLWIPYFAVSASLREQQEIIHDLGSIWESIRASSSLPGLYPPFVHDGELYLDGGLLNNLPVDIMRAKIGSGQKILAVSLSKPSPLRHRYYFPPMISFRESILTRLKLVPNKYIYPPFFETFFNSLLLGASKKERLNAKNADLLVCPDLYQFRMLRVSEKQETDLIQLGYIETINVIDKFLIANPDYKKILNLSNE